MRHTQEMIEARAGVVGSLIGWVSAGLVIWMCYLAYAFATAPRGPLVCFGPICMHL